MAYSEPIVDKLWQKKYQLNQLLELFTVGNDYVLDLRLVIPDCIASLAHAVMLEDIGIITGGELADLKRELCSIIADSKNGSFTISPSQEDCHTAIETRLTEKLGDAGKKIHTGRSRNDQVAAALRIFSRDILYRLVLEGAGLVDALIELADENADVPMPGRTHMQIAMPSSVGLWLAAFAEEILDDLELILTACRHINRSPLGSAASYGVPLPLNRELVSDLLGFTSVQNNVLYVNNSRGKFESIIIDSLDQLMLTFSKLAEDLIIFSMPEFGYFSLPDELCSGSSIMPQKKNPDGLELLRSKSALVTSYSAAVKGIIRSLPSGYNRDFQDTKGPLFSAIDICLNSLRIVDLTVRGIQIHSDTLIRAFSPEIFATDLAIEKVLEGKSFRDAYRETGENLDQLKSRQPQAALKKRTATGSPGNLNTAFIRSKLEIFSKAAAGEHRDISNRLNLITGLDGVL
jgi:argininosuccinate lyase